MIVLMTDSMFQTNRLKECCVVEFLVVKSEILHVKINVKEMNERQE